MAVTITAMQKVETSWKAIVAYIWSFCHLMLFIHRLLLYISIEIWKPELFCIHIN